ncbi:hypothetical protein BDV27DRAFT_149417 [Aspergillus caelatus]|uniref:Nucleotide-diphospho-sugar transferase n=1 Tax=Aspergillus caelatus TaxID=61420 RepID=A0A5N6ZPS6_9EURO|nr:uncharacterized protein BDV27DRAFT_149417 [Aspergillus caelatus]KAE8359624.1 hypothetical protein BDV27DRAFT_149417 [Aspergillus caelatus]
MWCFFLVECAFMYECCGEQLFTLSSAKGELDPPLPRLRLIGQNDLPLVEVFVPCCGETLDIILDTVRAACASDYPTARFLRPNLSYHSPGNLNYGLFEIKRPFPPEFIAIMDADCMPTPDFLRATLPHMLTQPKLAIVGSAQYYYNLPDGDPLNQALDYYSAIKILQLNRLGKSFASGSGCSILTQSGDQILVLTEMVQLGLIPASFEGHVFQTSRHKVEVSELMLSWSPSTSNAIPRRYRPALAWIGFGLTWKIVARYMMNIFIPLALASGQQLVPTTLLRLQMGLAVSYISAFWLYEWLRPAHTGFRFLATRECRTNSSFQFPILTLSLRTHSSGNQPARSGVTGSTQNPWNLPTAPYSIWSCYSKNHESDQLFTRVAWPPMLLLCYLTLTSSFTPLRCSIWPLRYPNRGLALGPHPNHPQAVFPREEVRLAVMNRQRPPLGQFYHLVLVPVVLAALVSFALVI